MRLEVADRITKNRIDDSIFFQREEGIHQEIP
jgi:hypothetical protein